MNPKETSQVNVVGSNSGNKYGKTQNNLKVKKNGGIMKTKKKNRICFHCGKKGHYIKECRFRLAGKGNTSGNSNHANMVEKEEKELVAMVTELNMATASTILDWFLDSGATVHVCNDKALFSSYNELETPEEVLMGNHDSAKVLGKGTVMMNFTSGQKLTLVNVFHVPEIKRNLVSANLMCKRGFKIILESDKVVISKNGVFVGKGYSLDGMFKLSINEIKA